MAGFEIIEFRNRTQILACLLLGLSVLLLILPDSVSSGLAGPAEAAGEVFTNPPGQAAVEAHSVITSSYLAVHSSSGVRQRLLNPVSFRPHDSQLPDFQQIRDTNTRKLEFFGFLKPMVDEENEALLQIRRRLGFIQDHLRFKRPIDGQDRLWLESLVKIFRLPAVEIHNPDFWSTLLRRVDSLPIDLVLVQAANESAWGTSRFAREGNNLFGQWCFRPGCGMVPAGRPAGATYEVAAFDSIKESIISYMRNLNTGRVYEDLRIIREKFRLENRIPEAAELANGLSSYSERGMAYVTDIRAMLRHNAPVIAQLGLP